ncbi:ATP-binding protein [Streptomyces sp. ACA25]|uniref:ATP-binding protein n=1 Tax=Streptomyces sp. ACA25 TaxID=3022596 RepID=UPI0023073986|nr:ATP-binding protein [Streptomyces sp. ACA25]MDB1088590.1 ATP-binding protein [Streptomyces sp. ACA25]
MPTARRHVRTLLQVWRLGHLTEAAVLITSELVTNAVQHTADGIGDLLELTVRSDGEALSIEVADSYQWAMPLLGKPGPEDIGGRGLVLVDLLSDAWGVCPRRIGKTVWVRLLIAGRAVPSC